MKVTVITEENCVKGKIIVFKKDVSKVPGSIFCEKLQAKLGSR
jgi:hypothetical protein